jgi:tetratricopeptide (TPR) repeat protein
MRRIIASLCVYTLLPCSVLLFWSVRAAADTIVLKNGRRITAMNVVEEGGKIRYLTSAGELSLPKSIVDHVERNGVGAESSGAGAPNLAVAPSELQPAGGGAEEIERAAVRNGSIDHDYIAKLEGEANSGGQRAKFNAAVAHHAASMFELSRGDWEHALSDERTALNYLPEEPAVLMTVAYIHLNRSEYKQSLEYLERARRVAPENPEVPKLEGWAYYRMSKLDEAVAEWKKALALRPDADVEALLDKARRDKKEEENYSENESSHFTLRYNGAAAPALARDVLRTLEKHYSAIESELNYSPPDSISVILYTQQAFEDITRAPGWVGALNDGRLRVPVQGLTGVDGELSRVLKHELTHSFVGQKTHSGAPTWLQEGLAQWMEGRRSGENAAALAEIYAGGHAPSLAQLEGSWLRFGNETAAYAYAWSLANVEYIVQTGGMGDVERILDRIGAGMSAEAAVREVTRSDYNDLMQSTAEYLRKTYRR